VSVDLRHFRRLFIAHPALSRQMQQLEREIDAPILVRTARGVEPTEAACCGSSARAGP
jgi:DNA-binding transcriptional LysR family regulator